MKIGFIPTMGFLHDGHLSLVRRARAECDRVVVSIFVNPTQFEPHEDFEAYPRDLERDRRLLVQEGVDELWIPSLSDIYPEGMDAVVLLELPVEITQILCGQDRPHHFAGVATVMDRLLKRVNPTDLYMGQKDYQQTCVIQWLLEGEFPSVHLRVSPTLREPDGLAMSSRNVYLSREERQVASRVYDSLQSVKYSFDQGAGEAVFLQQLFLEKVRHPMIKILYADIRGVECLQILDRPIRPGEAVFLVAVRVGTTRLIDNIVL